MATAPLVLPPPASNAGNNWQKAWKAYQADPIGGYAAYYNFLKGGSTGGPLLAAGNYPPPGSSGAPTSQNPGGTAVTPPPSTGYTGTGSHPNPPSGILMAPGLPESQQNPSLLSRFGDYNLDPYAIGTSYAPGAGLLPQQAPPVPASGSPSGAPAAPLPDPAPPPPTTPAPSPQPAPAPVPGAPGQPSGNGNGGGGFGGQGNAGNAGGAEGNHGGGLLGGGGNSGFGQSSPSGILSGGNGASGNSSAPPGSSLGGAWPAIDLTPWGSGLLSAAATAAPGFAGAGLGALQAAMRGYNTISTNQTRTDQGMPDTDFGQFLGSVLGMNNYGSLDGNRTIANPSQLGDRLHQVPAYNMANDFFGQFGAPAETAQGSSYQDGLGGLLGTIGGWLGLNDTSRALSIPEVNHLVKKTTDPDISALWAGADGNSASAPAQAHQVYSAPIGPTPSGAPMPSNVLSAKDQAALDKYNAMNGYDANGKASSGMAGGGATIDNGGIYSGHTSYNSNDSSSPNTNAAGQASNATGSYGQRGIGAGGYMRGGFVRGRKDRTPDNRRISANEGELILSNRIVGLLGPNAGLLNTPAVAKRVRGLLS